MVMTIIELIEKKSTYFRQVQVITHHLSPITYPCALDAKHLHVPDLEYASNCAPELQLLP